MNKNILQLDVPVSDVHGMHVLNGAHQLNEQACAFGLSREPPTLLVLHDLLEALPLHVLHDQVELPLGVDGVVEARYIIVVKLPHKFDLLDDAPLPLVVDELVLVIHLDCHVVPGFFVLSLLYDGVGTLPQDFSESIFTNRGVVEGSIL